jgi:hypothetical protein
LQKLFGFAFALVGSGSDTWHKHVIDVHLVALVALGKGTFPIFDKRGDPIV